MGGYSAGHERPRPLCKTIPLAKRKHKVLRGGTPQRHRGQLKRERALNMVAKNSEAARKASVDLSKEPTRKLMNLIQSAPKPLNQTSLQLGFPKQMTHGNKP